MHGRQKVQQSAEEEAKKQEERQKKVSAYQFAMTKIFAKRANSEYDQELMEYIAKVLSANPDITTLWNIRKEALLRMKNEEESEFNTLVPTELQLSEVCLRQNPKSYGAWQHRYWLMKETKFERVEDELKLCSKYLQYDDRNFHVWDYRRYLVEHSPKSSLEEELEFTTNKIQANFSNYSSWHLRSKLLPESTTDFLSEELNLIKNAAFTDPNDQSVWFYHKWLVNTHLQKVPLTLNYVGHTLGSLYLVFSVDVPDPSKIGINIQLNLRNNQTHALTNAWKNPWNKPKCKLWYMDIGDISFQSSVDPDAYFAVTKSATLQIPDELKVLEDKRTFHLKWNENSSKASPNALQVSSFLSAELAWVDELYEIEPDNKWVILTLIHLLRVVSFVEHENKILELIEILKILDHKRVQYYCDLSSKLNLEWTLIKQLKLQPLVCSYILPPF